MEQSVDDYPAETAATTSWSVRALICALYGIVLTFPAIWPGFIFGDDVLSYLVWSRHFADQLWAGDWYPRWLSGMNAGLGSQVMHFYGPVPLYITAMFRPLMQNDPEGWHQLGLAASLAVIASGFAAYAWLTRLVHGTAALIGAVLYMSAPYHVAVDLYQRFAFAELWGFVWMPAVLLFVHVTVRGTSTAIVGVALCYALLIMTHLPTVLTFSVVPLMYALWIAPSGGRVRALLRVAGGMSLGIGLSALYLLPAMTTQHYVRFDDHRTGLFYYGRHFLFDGPKSSSVDNTVSDRVGMITAFTAGLGVLAWLAKRSFNKNDSNRESTFWAVAGIASLFMMLPVSAPVWQLIPALQIVLFPFRFNTVLTISVAALCALAVSAALQERQKLGAALLLFACFPAILSSATALGNHVVLAREIGRPSLDGLLQAFGKDHPDLALTIEAAKLGRDGSFLPVWAQRELFSHSKESLDALKRLGNRRFAENPAGGPEALVTRLDPGRMVFRTANVAGTSLVVHQFYYPGWTAQQLGTGSPLPLKPSVPVGLIEVSVPPGEQEILLTREATTEELAGRVVSGVSLIVLLLAFAWLRSTAGAAARSSPSKPQGLEHTISR